MLLLRRLPPTAKAWARLLRRYPGAIRHYPRWRAALRPGAPAPLAAGLPWMVYGAIDWLRRHLRPAMRVLEWGSGGSTLFLAARVAELTSVEHDPAWHALVAAALRERGAANARYRLVPPAADPDAPPDYRSTDPRYPGMSFAAYAAAADALPDGSLDLAVVDGRARNGCVAHALPKLGPGGLLLLDNADRAEYAPALARLAGWPRRDFVGPVPGSPEFSQTTIWRRPS